MWRWTSEEEDQSVSDSMIQLALWEMSLVVPLTDEGASGRTPRGVDGDRKESGSCALCKGSAGVADLDISHALASDTQEQRGGKCVNVVAEQFSSRLD